MFLVMRRFGFLLLAKPSANHKAVLHDHLVETYSHL